MVLIYQNKNFQFYTFSDKIVRRSSDNEFLEVNIPECIPSKNNKKLIQEDKDKNIISIDCSNDGLYTAVVTEDKQLVLFDKDFNVLKNILIQKTANKICFTPNNEIIVADRNGDVYVYKRNENNDEPTLLLGHLSVILDLVISPCGKYIITCDRDEKIRVSCYPNAYNIVTYCLGHKEFITRLKLLKNNVLLSSSGDGTIGMWNYLEGKLLNFIDTKELVDKKVYESFVEEMNTEKVEVSTLPICDMQVHENVNVLIAISIYKDSRVHLYKVDPNNLKYNYVTNVSVDSELFYFFFSNDLYILSKNIRVLHLNENIFVPATETGALLENRLVKYWNTFKHENSLITLLYKRKYNNLQEYFDRKKQRLELKDKW